MTEAKFVMAQSDILPRIDVFMRTSYFANHPDFTPAEIRGVKAARSERYSYGDSAIGYVQVNGEAHNVKQKCYSVRAVYDEAEQRIVTAECEDCAAHLAWLHRRSEDPPSTSIDCYWKKSKLYIRAKELGSSSKAKPAPSANTRSLLPTLINHSKSIGHMESQLMKYYKKKGRVEKLFIHHLVNTPPNKPANATEFINYCRSMMDTSSCNEANLVRIDQNDCPLWHELQYARITASKMHEAAHCKVFVGTLCESIMEAIKLKGTEAMKRGRLLEKKILKEVEKKIKLKINGCGLLLNPDYPVFGTSPDGESIDYSIEIKCPSSEKDMSR